MIRLAMLALFGKSLVQRCVVFLAFTIVISSNTALLCILNDPFGRILKKNPWLTPTSIVVTIACVAILLLLVVWMNRQD